MGSNVLAEASELTEKVGAGLGAAQQVWRRATWCGGPFGV
jgi:hypothetical protein